MIRVAVVGYGNVGKYAIDAINEAPDMELAGVVRRSTTSNTELQNVKVVSDIKELGKVDVAILCVPTRSVPEIAPQYLSLGINTVDSYDIHGELWNVRTSLDEIGKKNGTVAVLSAGWDPGSDSVVRMLMLAIAPKGLTYTNFGPGMSMGHTVAVKSKKGVKNALSMTIPDDAGIHKRAVYIELEDGVDFATVEKEIKNDPYFIKDVTTVTKVDSVDDLLDMGHAVHMQRKGVSGKTQNQLLNFSMTINNPAATAQVMISCARASMKLNAGAYTMPEIPVIDLVYGDKEQLIKSLV